MSVSTMARVRQPLVHEERHRRRVDRQPFGLARPGEERCPEALQVLDGVLQRLHRGQHRATGAGELLWGGERCGAGRAAASVMRASSHSPSSRAPFWPSQSSAGDSDES